MPVEVVDANPVVYLIDFMNFVLFLDRNDGNDHLLDKDVSSATNTKPEAMPLEDVCNLPSLPASSLVSYNEDMNLQEVQTILEVPKMVVACKKEASTSSYPFSDIETEENSVVDVNFDVIEASPGFDEVNEQNG